MSLPPAMGPRRNPTPPMSNSIPNAEGICTTPTISLVIGVRSDQTPLEYMPGIVEQNTFPEKEVPNTGKNIVPSPRIMYEPMYKSLPSTCTSEAAIPVRNREKQPVSPYSDINMAACICVEPVVTKYCGKCMRELFKLALQQKILIQK